MKNDSFIVQLAKDDNPSAQQAQELLKAIQKALLCLDEGNTGRAAQLLYQALPRDLRPVR